MGVLIAFSLAPKHSGLNRRLSVLPCGGIWDFTGEDGAGPKASAVLQPGSCHGQGQFAATAANNHLYSIIYLPETWGEALSTRRAPPRGLPRAAGGLCEGRGAAGGRQAAPSPHGAPRADSWRRAAPLWAGPGWAGPSRAKSGRAGPGRAEQGRCRRQPAPRLCSARAVTRQKAQGLWEWAGGTLC